MSKNLLSIIIAVVLIVLGSLLIVGYNNGTLAQIWSSFNKPKVDITGIILFYGDGCSHCKLVEDFISQNKIEEKVKFTRLEVFNNRDNAQILLERSKACGINTDQVGVPFLWDGKTCLIGDPDVIKFFKNSAEIK
ncbi:MAG: hypothetical protein AAB509_02280 [Patescibacteria group bacterium]